MDKNISNITISDRKKSLEEQNSNAAHKVKSVKVEYASNFTIKPLIDFFNRTFRREVIVTNHDTEVVSANNEWESSDQLSYDNTENNEIHNVVNKDETNQESDPQSFSPHEETISNCSSFISCCSSFDSSFSLSRYHSFDDISFASDTNEDVFEMDSDIKNVENKETVIIENSTEDHAVYISKIEEEKYPSTAVDCHERKCSLLDNSQEQMSESDVTKIVPHAKSLQEENIGLSIVKEADSSKDIIIIAKHTSPEESTFHQMRSIEINNLSKAPTVALENMVLDGDVEEQIGLSHDIPTSDDFVNNNGKKVRKCENEKMGGNEPDHINLNKNINKNNCHLIEDINNIPISFDTKKSNENNAEIYNFDDDKHRKQDDEIEENRISFEPNKVSNLLEDCMLHKEKVKEICNEQNILVRNEEVEDYEIEECFDIEDTVNSATEPNMHFNRQHCKSDVEEEVFQYKTMDNGIRGNHGKKLDEQSPKANENMKIEFAIAQNYSDDEEKLIHNCILKIDELKADNEETNWQKDRDENNHGNDCAAIILNENAEDEPLLDNTHEPNGLIEDYNQETKNEDQDANPCDDDENTENRKVPYSEYHFNENANKNAIAQFYDNTLKESILPNVILKDVQKDYADNSNHPHNIHPYEYQDIDGGADSAPCQDSKEPSAEYAKDEGINRKQEQIINQISISDDKFDANEVFITSGSVGSVVEQNEYSNKELEYAKQELDNATNIAGLNKDQLEVHDIPLHCTVNNELSTKIMANEDVEKLPKRADSENKMEFEEIEEANVLRTMSMIDKPNLRNDVAHMVDHVYQNPENKEHELHLQEVAWSDATSLLQDNADMLYVEAKQETDRTINILTANVCFSQSAAQVSGPTGNNLSHTDQTPQPYSVQTQDNNLNSGLIISQAAEEEMMTNEKAETKLPNHDRQTAVYLTSEMQTTIRSQLTGSMEDSLAQANLSNSNEFAKQTGSCKISTEQTLVEGKQNPASMQINNGECLDLFNQAELDNVSKLSHSQADQDDHFLLGNDHKEMLEESEEKENPNALHNIEEEEMLILCKYEDACAVNGILNLEESTAEHDSVKPLKPDVFQQIEIPEQTENELQFVYENNFPSRAIKDESTRKEGLGYNILTTTEDNTLEELTSKKVGDAEQFEKCIIYEGVSVLERSRNSDSGNDSDDQRDPGLVADPYVLKDSNKHVETVDVSDDANVGQGQEGPIDMQLNEDCQTTHNQSLLTEQSHKVTTDRDILEGKSGLVPSHNSSVNSGQWTDQAELTSESVNNISSESDEMQEDFSSSDPLEHLEDEFYDDIACDELPDFKRSASIKAWSECNSVSSSSLMDRSCDSEGTFRRSFSVRRRTSTLTRRATISQFDRKPWNYGAGGSQYQQLLYPFGKRKRNSVI